MGISNLKNLKLLFVQDSLGTGGAERSTANFWYYLRPKGHDIKIIVLEHRQEGIEREILDAGFDVLFLDNLSFFHQILKLRSVIKSYDPDIVHTVLTKSSIRVRVAKLLTNFNSVESLVNCPYDSARLQDKNVNYLTLKAYQLFDKLTASWLTDHFIAITTTVKNHYINSIAIPKTKISVIYRGRKHNKFLSRRSVLRKEFIEEFGTSTDEIWLIHIGRQEFQKDHLTLLKSLIKFDVESNIRMFFLGRQGNYTSQINDYLEENTFNIPVHWLGHRNDVYQLLCACDIFIFPSRYEGLGGSLIEAQASGLPIVCTDIPVLNEVIDKDKNGQMFEVGNADELYIKLKKLISNKELRAQMSTLSLERHEKFFVENEKFQELIQLFNVVSTYKNATK